MQSSLSSESKDLLRNPWKSLLVGFAIIWIMIYIWQPIGGLIWWIVPESWLGSRQFVLLTENGRTMSRFMWGLGSLFTWGLSAWLWLLFKGEEIQLLPQKGAKIKGAGLLVLMVAFCLPLCNVLYLWPDRYGILEPFRETIESSYEQYQYNIGAFFDDKGVFVFLSNVVVICLIPALVEELFFRRLLAKTLQQIMGLDLAVWVSAFVFAFIHFEWVGFLVRVMLGVMLGYIYLKSGDLRASMLVHGLFNFIGVMEMTFGISLIWGNGSALEWWLALASLLCTSALLYIFGRRFLQQDQVLDT